MKRYLLILAGLLSLLSPSAQAANSSAIQLIAAYITGGTQYYQLFTGLVPGTGAALTASTTAYCFFGTVSESVTIKGLAARVATGVTGNAEVAIYSFASPPTNTMTLVDTVAAQTSVGTSTVNVTWALNNTTDNLSDGYLYAFCTAASSAVTMASYTGSTGAMAILGTATATLTNVLSAASVLGRSFAVTYNATPATTFPGTLSYSTGTDITTGIVPAVAFLVN
jgi:hypothetical protein